MSIGCQGDISMIPKSAKGTGVQNLRPITILAVLHRLWAATRLFSDVFEWQESIVKGFGLRGCRPNSTTHDLVLPLAMRTQRSRRRGRSLKGTSYDLAKAFDTMPFEAKEGEAQSEQQPEAFGWLVLKKLGFPELVMAVLMDMYARIERRFKIRGSLGAVIAAAQMRGSFCTKEALSLRGRHGIL